MSLSGVNLFIQAMFSIEKALEINYAAVRHKNTEVIEELY
jgi:hypothetical protein